MKRLLYILSVMVICNVSAATEFRVNDGKVQFATHQVANEFAYSASEKNALVSKYSSSTTVYAPIAITPTSAELNLSTCVAGKISPDIIRTPTKDNLVNEIEKIKVKSDLHNDLDPNSAIAKDYLERYNWLKALYKTLP